MKNRTFAMIKPDAVKNNYTGKIYDRILGSNFKIIAAKLKKITKEEANSFYEIHSDKPFYNELTDFMSSGHSMVLVLEKDNAVLDWRNTIGATNPEDADVDTIRKDFASSLSENAVHGSDSNENAKKEINFFFSDSELI
jgi:nucleoside-diphosphate kinase